MFYEDFLRNARYESASRTISDADIRAFADLSGDHNALHLDPAAARAAGFDGPIAHGALGLAVATGLASGLNLTRGTLIALAEIAWRFRAPINPGDRVTLALTVTSCRRSSRPDRGVVKLAAELKNQEGVVVQEGTFVEIVRCRGAAK